MFRKALQVAGIFSVLIGSAVGASPDVVGSLSDARKELFAARYPGAIELYRKVLIEDPSQGEAYYGLVRAFIGERRAKDAYAAATEGIAKAPQSAATQSAAGMAEYRRGNLEQSEHHYLNALKLDPNYPGALRGMAMLYSAISRFKSSRDLMAKAYLLLPEDPALALYHAGTLSGAELIPALEKVLAMYDPESREARSLRARVASDKTLAGRHLRRLTSPYQDAEMKLIRLYDSANHPRGLGVKVRFNNRQTATLLLNTSGSGFSLSPAMAEKAGLELLTDLTTEMNGIGSQAPPDTFHYVAAQIQIGSVEFADYPVSVYRTARTADFDGYIGLGTFQRFLITVDFPGAVMRLAARPKEELAAPDEPVDARALAPGFQRVFRFGSDLTTQTSVNKEKARLFLIDSAAATNLIDSDFAREASLTTDSRTPISGAQGAARTLIAKGVWLSFGGFHQDNPAMYSVSLQGLSDSIGVALGGALGMPVLSYLTLTIDYRNGSVHFAQK